HEELGLFVQAGLTPYQALRGATHDAAEFLGEQDEFGTVAEGLRADVILLNGNPLADIANLKRRSGVMLRGSWFSQPELERRLEEQTAALESTTARSVTALGSNRVPSDH
ncbi:MAG: amidohydrolase family protein, partial [Gemmatimonadota bacterium]